MKFRIIQVVLSAFIVFTFLPRDSNGQSVLNKKVSLTFNNAELRKVLESVEKQASIRFVYSPNTIDDSKKMSFKNGDSITLRTFFDALLSGSGITFKILGDNKFLLFIAKDKKGNLTGAVIPETNLPLSVITGTIKDSLGKPLEGVTVKLKNRNISAISDKDGRYTIKIDDTNATLSFSHVGYATKEKFVGASTNIDVSMIEIASTLNEVVVIGYGSVKKKDLTGSVSKVDMSDLQKAPVRSFDEALAGRVAGVQVSSADGQPGAAVNIVIRGSNSITQDNSPLYVIDGFPIENPNNNVIDPSEIESMEILKDASATAIYGARGANGVIIITTKKGKVGAPVISFEPYYGVQKKLKEIPLMDGYDFVKYQLELSPTAATSTYLINGRTLDSYKTIPATNWQDMMFRDGSIANAHIAVTGGSEKTKYSISGSAFGQNGIIINSGYDRYQGRIVLDQIVNDKLKVGVNINYSNLSQFGVPASAVNSSLTTALMYSVWGYRPVTGDSTNLQNLLFDPVIDATNDYRINPIISTNNQLLHNTTNALVANAYADYNISNELKLRVTLGTVRNQLRADVFNNSNTLTGNTNSAYGANGVNGSINYSDNNSWVNENTLSYNKRINENNQLVLVGGATFQGDLTDAYGYSAKQIPLSVQSLGLGSLSSGTPVSVVSNEQNWTLASFLARGNYTLNSKYLFTASFRADGSSKFIGNNRWGYFPSGAFAWRFSSEKFAKQLTWLSDAKLRTSYGVTGNNRVGDFAYSYSISEPLSAAYAFDNGVTPGAIPTTLGNANLKWETTSQADVGLDISIFNNRIDITTDYYRKNTSNLLLNANLRPSIGFSNDYKNIGDVQNQGFEFSFTTINVQSAIFRWTTSFNISFNKSKIISLADNEESLLTPVNWDNGYNTTPLYVAKVGQPMAQIIGYVWDGVYQLKDFNEVGGKYILKTTVPNNGNTSSTIQPGDIKYKDINGDGVVDNNDITVIGHPFPKHTGGFTNNLKYKNFDLNLFFQWSYGNDIVNLNRLVFDGNQPARANLNQFASYDNRWSMENPNTNIYRTGGEGPQGIYSSRVVENGSYLRLKTVAIGYNLIPAQLKGTGIRTLRVYVSGQNLITWTKYTGYDPEVSNYQTALTPGADYSPYPRARTMTVGANVTF